LLADRPDQNVVDARRNERKRGSTDAQRDQGMLRVQELIQQADAFRDAGQYRQAALLLKQGVSVVDSLYPTKQFPQGHPNRAILRQRLGVAFENMAEPSLALSSFNQALEMFERVYPKAQFPQGHPDISICLNDLGRLLKDMDEDGRAEGYLRRALEMRVRLYPPERFPQGHFRLAVSLENWGMLLAKQGEPAQAESFLRRAQEMLERLYPPEQFPHGHPDLAKSLMNRAHLLVDQGKTGQALSPLKRALEMFEQLYPRTRFPQGQPDISVCLHVLGQLLMEMDEDSQAESYLLRALEMRERLYPPEQFPQGHHRIAESLETFGNLLEKRGAYDRALETDRRGLEMFERLYPPARYPLGQPELAASLHNLGFLFERLGDHDQALAFLRRGFEMNQRLYPPQRYPRGHHRLQQNLSTLAGVYLSLGDYGQALSYFRRALLMGQQLYPTEGYPQGHPELAESLNALGFALVHEGEFGQALGYYRQALEMRERLYPEELFPRGHRNLALSLNNLGEVLQEQGKNDFAVSYHRRALAMFERLHPLEESPQGHFDLVMSLNNLAGALSHSGDHGQAVDCFRRALEMNRKLYSPDRYPEGHSRLCMSLHNLGGALQGQGDYEQSLGYYREALEMTQKLHPRDLFPRGHREMVGSLNALGSVLHAQGRSSDALSYLVRAVAMSQALLADFLGSASEAEAFNFEAAQEGPTNLLLSASRVSRVAAHDIYSVIWSSKAAAARMVQLRQRTLIESSDPRLIADSSELFTLRHRLAGLLLARDDPASKAAELTRALTARKEELERSLSNRLPEFRRALALNQPTATDLGRRLRQNDVFIDIYLYYDFQYDLRSPGKAGERRTKSYAAFVLRRGQDAALEFLGPAAPIDSAVEAWRADLRDGRPDPAAETLRRLVWEKLAPHLPSGTDTVYVSPDGALTRLPWSALSGRAQASILLEEYAVAVVPSGPLLLDRLTPDRVSEQGAGRLLAVGDVHYGDRPTAPARPAALAFLRAPVNTDKTNAWPLLPGTLRELDAVKALAGDRPVLTLTGRDADTSRVLAELPGARWALLATHGFFADPKFRSALQLDESNFQRGLAGIGLDRTAPGARSPLVLSGLVLAGANRPVLKDEDGLPQGDGGILTAEAVAGLPLQGLELVVLSACETGLGEVAGGEGVFGLQRAFHTAGAHDVIATLWRVDDEATAALMKLFFRKLWIEGKPPLAALREAQLFVYHNPDRIGDVARARGPDFGKEVTVAQGPVATSPRGKRAAARLWAGFVISGAGREP
jgi:tetratricopeptide (TPR) repeat protein